MDPREQAVLAAAPLLRELRRRHPDVDVVVLEDSPPAGATDLPRTTVEDARLVAGAGDALRDGLLARAAGSPVVRPAHGWTHVEARPEVHEAWSSGAVDTADERTGRAALERLGDDLLARGFDARPAADRRPVLTATDGHWAVTARAVGGVVSVEVTGAGLRLAAADVRTLRAEARR